MVMMAINNGTPLDRVLKRDRAILIFALAAVWALAWIYTIRLARGASGITLGMEMAMPQMWSWGALNLIVAFVMWAVMMVAVMIPSAAPIVLLFAAVNRSRREQGAAFVPTGVFLLGYLAVWTGFSALATLAQWGLHATALLSPTMVGTSPILGGVLLLTTGVFQWTPLKDACLAQCRSPLGFVATQWREGTWGALVMGLRHGSYCVGCCWALMSLLFVVGVMNVLWMAIISAFVLIEKIPPLGHRVTRPAGVLLIGWGAWMAAGALL